MRLFLAIRLSDAMRETLVRTQRELYGQGVRGNFTPAENLHLTLAFIGEYPDAQAVLEAIAGVAFTPFELKLRGMGCFQDLWWAGLEQSEALEALVRRLRRALAEHDIPFDRKRFSPHITLIRRAAGKMPAVSLRGVVMTADSVTLMRSDRGRNGMIYTPLGTLDA